MDKMTLRLECIKLAMALNPGVNSRSALAIALEIENHVKDADPQRPSAGPAVLPPGAYNGGPPQRRHPSEFKS